MTFLLKQHAKVFAALSAPVGLLANSLQDGSISRAEGKSILAGLGAAMLVYLFPNANPSDKPTKVTLEDRVAALEAKEDARPQ